MKHQASLYLVIALSGILSCGGGSKVQSLDPPLDSSIEMEPIATLPPVPPPQADWLVPNCEEIIGPGAIMISKNAGISFLANSGEIDVNQGANIILTSNPNFLVAEIQNSSGVHLYRSLDAGCTWQEFANVLNGAPSSSSIMYPAPDGSIYMMDFGTSENDKLHRINKELNAVRPINGPVIRGEIELGMFIDPGDAEHIRIVSDSIFYDSIDGGATWNEVGMSISGGIQSIAFAPKDAQHVVVNSSTELAMVTFNGGDSWQKPQLPSDELDDSIHGFEISFSDSDNNVVWMKGKNFDAWDRGEELTRLYFSSDGGLSFSKALEEASDVDIFGPFLVNSDQPHKVTYMHSTAYGGVSNIYEFDAYTQTITRHQHSYNLLGRIWWGLRASPIDPKVLYLAKVLQSPDSHF